MRNYEDYQRKRKNPYILPDNLYKQTLYQIRDINRIHEELKEEISLKAVQLDGMPRGSKTGDSTAYIATKRAEYQRIYDAVMDAKKEIPEALREGVWRKIMYNAPYPGLADPSTYWRWKCKFIYLVAKNLNLA